MITPSGFSCTSSQRAHMRSKVAWGTATSSRAPMATPRTRSRTSIHASPPSRITASQNSGLAWRASATAPASRARTTTSADRGDKRLRLRRHSS
ncbi:MAG: hypothetical protein DMF78_04595 [Acidobacteria bacterium]|nr:MAG: hypothetical protein DMF78_04595 [Acidobacteriota bacterium]